MKDCNKYVLNKEENLQNTRLFTAMLRQKPFITLCLLVFTSELDPTLIYDFYELGLLVKRNGECEGSDSSRAHN